MMDILCIRQDFNTKNFFIDAMGSDGAIILKQIKPSLAQALYNKTTFGFDGAFNYASYVKGRLDLGFKISKIGKTVTISRD